MRLVRQEYAKNTTKEPLGIVGLFPKDSNGWIKLLNKNGEGLAPNGGRLMYLR
jgi:hypothetical protein